MDRMIKTLLLNAMKVHGRDTASVLGYIEEALTLAEYKEVEAFLGWLHQHGLIVGWGTIELRWSEWKGGKEPVSREAAYVIALREAGVTL